MSSQGIKLHAQLPANYASREMRLCLTKNGKKWEFCYRDADGYCTPLWAIPPHEASHWRGFKTRGNAAAFAKRNGFPPYAVWDGRSRTYNGWDDLPKESHLMVHARNKDSVSWKGEIF